VTQTILTQIVAPLLVWFGWYILAGLAGSILGNMTKIEVWVAMNPTRALIYRVLCGSGLDFRKILRAIKEHAEQRAAARQAKEP
jgi:hypothetical protein